MDKYTLWVVPQDPVYTEIKTTISYWSDKLSTPDFHQHMTLLGDIVITKDEFIEKSQKLAEFLSSFELEIGDVEISSTYYQCVFARVKTNAKLLEAFEATCDLFEIEEEKIFMPHISLVYGDISMRERDRVARKIELSNTRFTFDSLTLTPAWGGSENWIPFDTISLNKD